MKKKVLVALHAQGFLSDEMLKKELSKHKTKKPSLHPQRVNDQFWYYEGIRHFHFVHEVRTKLGNYIQTDIIKVPVGMIKRSLSRVK